MPPDNSDPGTLLNAASTGGLENPNPGGAPANEPTATPTPPEGAPADSGTPENVPAAGGEDWATIRARVAGEDDKVLARLSRYSTLDEYIKAGIEAQNKLGERVPDKAPPKDASEEVKAAYRAANNLPATPKDYKVELPDGLILGEADQPVADRFLEIAHAHNIPPAAANEIIAGQLALQEEYIKQQEAADTETREATRALLTSSDMWGSEATANLNQINNLLDNSPPGTKEQLMGARLADGSLLGNNADALRWLSTIARQVNPTATIVPSNGRTALVSAKEEMASLEKLMGDRSSDYWVGPSSSLKQQRYLELVDYVQKTTPR